jgi:predicted esterase YcpF (UPF0227 family)
MEAANKIKMGDVPEISDAPQKSLLLLEFRALFELNALLATFPVLSFLPRGDGHPVLVFPGLVASDVSTLPLRTFLRWRGYVVHGWGAGRNLGSPGTEDGMATKVRELHAHYGTKVSLIGWSLGGLYAREIAQRLPDHVRQVITLGSPLTGSPKANHAWRLYEFVSGQHVENVRRMDLEKLPSFPTTAIYSRTDGVCAWQCCVESEGPQAENIEIESSHCGMGHHPAAIYAIADRLAQREGTWRPFERSGWRSLLFPDPRRP